MDARYTGSTPILELHINQLLENPERLLGLYDRSAGELIEVGRLEGYFEGWDLGHLKWPSSRRDTGPADISELQKRAELVNKIFLGVSKLRGERLSDAYSPFNRLTPAYHEGNRLYLQLKHDFLARGAGNEQNYLQLYQAIYVEALAKGDDLFSPDAGEAALSEARIFRAPLSHAQPVAEDLPTAVLDEDPRWEETYSCKLDDHPIEASLRDLLKKVAERALDYVNAGGLLATHFNTYNNLGWFGSSIWKVIVDVDLSRHQIQIQRPGSDPHDLAPIQNDIHLGIAMLVEFLQAHREDPARLKPEKYWYGQDYSYLTRDMLDLAQRLIHRLNERIEAAGQGKEKLQLPPLLAGSPSGRFLEYPHVGRQAQPSPWNRTLKLLQWAGVSWKVGRRRARLAKLKLSEDLRWPRAWQEWVAWSDATLRIFGIQVKVSLDPSFHSVAKDLELTRGKQKVLFLPTHQSLLDHPIMYRVLTSPELMSAMGWREPVSCAFLARTGLSKAGVRIGRFDMTMFGVSSKKFDRLFEELDGYVTRERLEGTGPTALRLVEALKKRPGVIYPMATVGAFDVQLFPLQHAMFAQLPQDVIIIPIAFRGAHALWPKCPKGNLQINSGLVEAVVAPPMLGETTLLPKRRSLRIQLEATTLFQAVHITSLLNPEPSAD